MNNAGLNDFELKISSKKMNGSNDLDSINKTLALRGRAIMQSEKSQGRGMRMADIREAAIRGAEFNQQCMELMNEIVKDHGIRLRSVEEKEALSKALQPTLKELSIEYAKLLLQIA
jgi:hypothetical protein